MQVDTKPASDIVAGAVARAASQGTIHPLDTLKVRMQAKGSGMRGPLSKFGRLVPPPGAQSLTPPLLAPMSAHAPVFRGDWTTSQSRSWAVGSALGRRREVHGSTGPEGLI